MYRECYTADMKTALVTGASKGIGAAAAIRLAQDGYVVAINYRSDDSTAAEVLQKCTEYSEGHILVKGDVSVESDVAAMCVAVKDAFGSLDALVNSAGIFAPGDSPTNVEAFERNYQVNFMGTVLSTKHALPLMSEGAIVNVTSIHGRIGHGGARATAYSAMKAALESYTKNIAKDVAPSIRVNAVAPGRVATPMWGSPDEDQQITLGDVHAIKRMIKPEEVADAIAFLITNQAMCGEILTIDGGMSLLTLG